MGSIIRLPDALRPDEKLATKFYEAQPRAERSKDREWVHYFTTHDTWVDARARDCLILDPTCELGWDVRLVTLAHATVEDGGQIGDLIGRPIRIGAKAWVCSFATLWNCVIGHHSVVAVGSVVRTRVVPPYAMVEGNPAQLVGRWNATERRFVPCAPEPLAWNHRA